MKMKVNFNDLYDFECEVVQHKEEKALVINYDLYRSAYYEQNKGTKTVKCEFTIVKYGKGYSCFVFAIDDNKKKKTKDEFRGNLLWGFGKELSEKDMLIKLASYKNMDEVKKDFGL